MPETWFTSDTHYGHTNVIGYSKRPFASVEDMEEGLVARFNERVCPGDTVYHLGDFAWRDDIAKRVLSRLNGHIHLIAGNHDHTKVRKLPGFASVQHYLEFKLDNRHLVLCHYAMRVFNQSHRGAWQLHGHSHGSLKDDPSTLQTDVGVDCWDYRPVSFDEIRQVMSRKQWRPVDHHGEDE